MLKTQSVRAYYLFDLFLLFKAAPINYSASRNIPSSKVTTKTVTASSDIGEIAVGDIPTEYVFKLTNVYYDKMIRDIFYKRRVN